MTQEDKKLLLKDLCARLPYGVKLNADYIDFNRDGKLFSINNNKELILSPERGYPFDVAIEKCKPYLFPLSSMTEEQRREYAKAQSDDGDIVFSCAIKYIETGADTVCAEYHAIEWLIAHHFDYRGLIEKSLALDATDKNIY